MSSEINERAQAHVDQVAATLDRIRQGEGVEVALACAAGSVLGAVDWSHKAAGVGAGAQLLIWAAERAIPDVTETLVGTLAAAVAGHLMVRQRLHGEAVADAAAEALIRGAATFLAGKGEHDRVRALLATVDAMPDTDSRS